MPDEHGGRDPEAGRRRALIDAIVDDLAARFTAPRDLIARDVLAMLQRSRGKGRDQPMSAPGSRRWACWPS